MSECNCQLPSQWAKDPNVPIQFDPKLNEYNLLGDARTITLYYCPFCGRRLPESKRGELFVEASPEEQSALQTRLKGMKTIGEVIAILGEPDIDFGSMLFQPEDKAIYGYIDVIRAIRYNRLAKTIEVTVQELEDGNLQIIYTAQIKPTEKEALENEWA